MLHANNVTVHLQTNAQSVQAQTLDWSTVHAGLIILALPTYQYMILMTIHAKTQFMIQIFLVPMELTTCSQANQTGLVVKHAMLAIIVCIEGLKRRHSHAQEVSTVLLIQHSINLILN